MEKGEKKFDPTDDEMYKNLSLTDFLRYFVPQEASQKEEIERINAKGTLPFLDPNVPESMPQPNTRAEKRQRKLQDKKKAKKDAKIQQRVQNALTNPGLLKKEMEDPMMKAKIQKTIGKLLQQ